MRSVLSKETNSRLLQKCFPQPDVLKFIPEAVVRKYSATPIYISGGRFKVAMAIPMGQFWRPWSN